jgi:hypothetical protein
MCSDINGFTGNIIRSCFIFYEKTEVTQYITTFWAENAMCLKLLLACAICVANFVAGGLFSLGRHVHQPTSTKYVEYGCHQIGKSQLGAGGSHL